MKVNLGLFALLMLLFSHNAPAADTAQLHFVRPFDPMTLTQVVKLTLDKQDPVKLRQKTTHLLEVKKGKHRIQTKVGISLGVPNVTGYNGARKFKMQAELNNDHHYFKVVYKPGMLTGRHEVIEIDEVEYNSLVAKAKN